MLQFRHFFLQINSLTSIAAIVLTSVLLHSTLVAAVTDNYTCFIKSSVHDFKLEIGSKRHFTLLAHGNVLENVTIYFTYQENKVLEPLPNFTLNQGIVDLNLTVNLFSNSIGHSLILVNSSAVNMVDVSGAYVRVSVHHSEALSYVCDVVGWVYFVAWSVSFYPQTYLNWKRRSVIGLHFDFLSLNIIGFFVYSLFNLCLYAIPVIQGQYFRRHPFGVIPVQLNDVFFSIHAFVACCVQVVQCIYYERGSQHVTRITRSIITLISIASLLALVLASATVYEWLDFLYFMSYVKLFITFIKYFPQAYYNYQRKSTSGWSIGNIFLDFTGGTLSIIQMFLLAYNYNDWGSIFGDPTKFGLGVFSIFFDVFFIVQHYVLYKTHSTGFVTLDSPSSSAANSLMGSTQSAGYGTVN